MHLEASSPLATFQVLSSLAERGELRSIRQLVFNLRGTRHDADTERYKRQYTGELLQSLHPLEQLTMSPFWGDNVVFDILLHKHGQSLRKLSLDQHTLLSSLWMLTEDLSAHANMLRNSLAHALTLPT